MTTTTKKILRQLKNSFFAKVVAILVLILFANRIANAGDFFWKNPADATNSWFDVNNWHTNYNGLGDSYLPLPSDNTSLNGGVCYIDAGADVAVARLGNFASWMGGTSFTLDVEAGATLTISDYFILGNYSVDATVNVSGQINVLNAANKSFVLGGYNAPLTNNTGILNIDGGSVRYGEGSSGTSPILIGGASTGRVEITNGGLFYNKYSCHIGNGEGSQSDGTVILQDGSWTNAGGVIIGSGAGTGKVIVNDGEITSMSVESCLQLGSSGGNGYFEMNGGKLIGRHAFNDTRSNANRAMTAIACSVNGTGLLIQNGGYIESVGLNLGKDGGTATAIISNGVFQAMSNNGSWPCFNIYDKSTLSIAGGDFLIYTNSGLGWIRSGGTLEFIDGSMSACEEFGTALYTASNATIRIVGPKCDINVGWWRHNSGNPEHTTMELVLTQDAGHLSTLKSPRSNLPAALPGIIDAGFAGGACLLATNQLTCIWAGRDFDYTLVNPANYDLELWDVAKFDVPTGGDNMNLTLKPGASLGAVSLPLVSTASFSTPQAYGYVEVERLNFGMLPELTVEMTMTAGAKSLDQVVKDLQTAGFTNSVMTGAETIAMKIPADKITMGNGYFGWDFREFDGTVNAEVSALAFSFNLKGTLILIQ
ncbi:MAG: hypothetical protein PHO37_17135 [Kiritimatiellae bacterium]|nr:hypothetical protein [Kiritimatiellia bacterium]